MDSLLSLLRRTVDAPWLRPYAPAAQRVLRSTRVQSIAEALNSARDERSNVRFVDHEALPEREPYETFIAREAAVPTRDNAHDLFNGLVWLTYPLAKQRLNDLQATQIAARGIRGTRGAVRDALTVLDENGAFLQAPRVIVDALRARAWRTLFIEHRHEWRHASVVIFGHALMEKLLEPRKAITAHVWAVADCSDQHLASILDPDALDPKPLYPMPILGVPGWWRANEEPSFYDDADVFRTSRRGRQQ